MLVWRWQNRAEREIDMMKSTGVLWLIVARAAAVVAQNKYAKGIRIKIIEKTNECGN